MVFSDREQHKPMTQDPKQLSIPDAMCGCASTVVLLFNCPPFDLSTTDQFIF